jgi:hypothetical protein
MSTGKGFAKQDEAAQIFLATLDDTQRNMLNEFMHHIFTTVMSELISVDGNPTQAFLAQIDLLLPFVAASNNSKNVNPETSADASSTTAASQDKLVLEEMQALLSEGAVVTDRSHFQNFFPLVQQFVVCSGLVLPALRTHATNRSINSMEATTLIDTLCQVSDFWL